MNIEEGLDKLDEFLDKATTVPFSSKKMVDVEAMREMVDDIRLAMPSEIKKARDMTRERQSILDDANKQGQEIIKKAEEKAKELIAEQLIVQQAHEYAKAEAEKANAEAAQIIENAKAQDLAIRKAMVAKLSASLEDAQAVLTKNIDAVAATHEALEKIAGAQAE